MNGLAGVTTQERTAEGAYWRSGQHFTKYLSINVEDSWIRAIQGKQDYVLFLKTDTLEKLQALFCT